MKTKTSARYFALAWVMGMAIIVVAGYTVLLYQYFFKGLALTNTYILETQAREFDRAYQTDPNTPLPRALFMTAYLGLDQLPDWVKQVFPPGTHIHYKASQAAWWPEGVSESDHAHRHILFLYSFPLYNGEMLYLFQEFTPEHAAKEADAKFERITDTIWPLGAFFLAISLLGTLLLIQRLKKPIETLASWADSLSIDNKNDPRPHFQYQEHDQIAEKLQQAFQRIGSVMDREHQFLRHASHELRTPIAVLRSNIELLNRIETDCQVDDRMVQPWQRIERAVANMQHITETLLWLSREESIAKKPQPVLLHQTIAQLLEDNNYLLHNKQVEVISELSKQQIYTTPTPCRIALSNLIRNAYQHTQHGWIRIELSSAQVVIANADTEASGHNGSDYGFGLGLRLVEKICQQMEWQFRSENIPGGRRVTLQF